LAQEVSRDQRQRQNVKLFRAQGHRSLPSRNCLSY